MIEGPSGVHPGQTAGYLGTVYIFVSSTPSIAPATKLVANKSMLIFMYRTFVLMGLRVLYVEKIIIPSERK